MLVCRLQEFIRELSLREASFNSEDLALLSLFKENFSSLDVEKELPVTKIALIESIFAQRWNKIIDTPKDYTLASNETPDEWVALAKAVGKATNKPFLTILIPGVQPASAELELSALENLTDLYIGNDDKTLHSITNLKQCLKPLVPNLNTHGKFDSYKLITIKELYRIRNKKQLRDTKPQELASSFWDYFIRDLVPLWQTNSIKRELLSTFSEVIYTFLDCKEINDFANFKIAFKDFCNYLNSFAAEDINALYSIPLEYEQNTIYLVQVLIDCLSMPTDLAKKLSIVLDKIYAMHSPLFFKEKSLERAIQKKHYFEFHNLQELLNELSISTLPSFKSKISLFQNKFITQQNFNFSLLDEVTDLLSMSWREVIGSYDNLALSHTKNGPTLWHCLVSHFAPLWRETGQLPVHLLPDLLAIIDAYHEGVDSGNNLVLKRCLVDFINNLKVSKLEDVNYLYSIRLKVRGKQFYLLELLIELLRYSENLAPRLKEVAQWIYKLDHSLIAKHNQLSSLYQTLQAGPYYTVFQLKILVNALSIDSASGLLKAAIEKLKQKIACSEKVAPYLVTEIVKIFALRWQEIIDTPLDYTRLTEGQNQSWIALAQYLEGASLINFLTPANYYKLLIPTLEHGIDFITREKITIYPLTHYILSEQGNELIFMPNCVNNFKFRKTFYNCNHLTIKPFTSLEKERIKHSLPHFVRCFIEAEEESHDTPVSQKTILEVKKLVEGTLYPEGLYLGNDITENQLDKAENSYTEFLYYLSGLPEDERLHLLNQVILFDGRKITFQEVLEQVLDKGECLVVYAQYFLKFVLDYAPFTRFPADWEYKVRVEALRLQSAKKVYSDYAYISFEEAIKRILILGVSVMTHTFKYLPLTGVSSLLWDCSNTVTKTGSDIMNLIKQAIITGNFTQARFIYASLIESVIKPAVIDDGYRVALLRYPDTIAWLGKILDESIFKQASTTCFEPDTLLTVLWSYKNKENGIRPQIELFLEEVILTLLQSQNNYLKWIRINIKFSEFLKEISKEEREEILMRLREKVEPIPPANLVKIIGEFLIHRIACQVARSPKSFGLFKDSPINSFVYQKTIKRFQRELSQVQLNEQSWYQLPKVLQQIAKSILFDFEVSPLSKYFNKFTKDISFLENRQETDEAYFSSSLLPIAS